MNGTRYIATAEAVQSRIRINQSIIVFFSIILICIKKNRVVDHKFLDVFTAFVEWVEDGPVV